MSYVSSQFIHNSTDDRPSVNVRQKGGMSATPSNPRLRVVVADDHTYYRRGLVGILSEAGVEVVAQAANGRAAIEATLETLPDVVVMDLNMPGMTGFEATRQLTERAPLSRVLVLTVSAQEADVVDAIIAGASGYVLKDGPIEEVIAGIEAVAGGTSLISPRIALTLLRRTREQAPADPGGAKVRLSARELQVLALLAEGCSNSEIGEQLVISPSTVRNHISSILMKLHVENRVQAAVRAVRDRLV
jgi:DNA-binding NarL/FixJ family response regulator